jgi:hypothetical protein
MAITGILLLAGHCLAANFDGKWKTNLGTLIINQTGNRVQGTYSGSSGKLQGTVSGNKLQGTYSWKDKKGVYELLMNDEGTSFTGTWSRGNRGGKWNGKRISKVPEKAATGSFAGSSSQKQVEINGKWIGSRNGKGVLVFWQKGNYFEVMMTWPRSDPDKPWEIYKGQGQIKNRRLSFEEIPPNKTPPGIVYHLTVGPNTDTMEGYYTGNGKKSDRKLQYYKDR